MLTNLPRPSMQHPLFYLRFPFVHALGLLDSWTLGWDESGQFEYIQRLHSKMFKSLKITVSTRDPDQGAARPRVCQICSNGEGFQLAEEKNGHRVKLSRAESSWVKLTNSSHLVTEFLPDSDPPVTRCLFANQPPATYGKAQSGRILAWLGWWYLRAGFSHPAKHAVLCIVCIQLHICSHNCQWSNHFVGIVGQKHCCSKKPVAESDDWRHVYHPLLLVVRMHEPAMKKYMARLCSWFSKSNKHAKQ